MTETRLLVELALPARLFQVVADGKTFSCFDRFGAVVDPGGYAELCEVRRELREAVQEALGGLPPPRRASACRHLEKAASAALTPIDGHPAAKATRALLWWLAGLIESGQLELYEGSAADRAITKLMSWTDETFDLVRPVERDALDASARKAARRIADALARAGYFVAEDA